MELTQADAFFSRIAMVLFLCTIKCFWNDLKLHGVNFGINKKYWRKNQVKGAPPLATGVGGAPPDLVGPLDLHRPQLQLHIFSFEEKKNQREGFITFYDMEPPPSPVLPREGRSRVHSGLRRGESVAIVIINHPPSPIS